MFCAPELVFGYTDDVRSHFHILNTPTRFRRYRGPRVTFSYFALPNLFSAVPGESVSVFIFCPPGLIFGCTEVVGSRFRVLHSRTLFRRCGGRRVPFSCFALPDSFWAVPRASGPVFMFCAPGHFFDDAKGVGSRFHVLHFRTPFGGSECFGSRFLFLRPRTRFRRYRGCRVAFSCFACPDSFSAVLTVSGPIFIFCTPELIFNGSKGVGSYFHVLRPRTSFLRYRERRVPFSCFAFPETFSTVPGRRVEFSCFASAYSFSMVPMASGLIFMYSLPDTFSAVRRASGPVFMFCGPELVFDSTEGVEYHFHVLRSRTHFRRNGGRSVPFSCFALSDSFSAVLRASGPVIS
jgi:hypothetical protein